MGSRKRSTSQQSRAASCERHGLELRQPKSPRRDDFEESCRTPFEVFK